jgi:hypothetical protein
MFTTAKQVYLSSLNKQARGFATLPTEVLCLIARSLFDIDDLHSFSLTCKALHKSAEEVIWRTIEIQMYQGAFTKSPNHIVLEAEPEDLDRWLDSLRLACASQGPSGSRCSMLIDAIRARPRLARHIRTLTLQRAVEPSTSAVLEQARLLRLVQPVITHLQIRLGLELDYRLTRIQYTNMMISSRAYGSCLLLLQGTLLRNITHLSMDLTAEWRSTLKFGYRVFRSCRD